MIDVLKKFTTKDGREAVIRRAVPNDAEEVLRVLGVVDTETRFLLREPGEADFTVEWERSFLERANEGRGAFLVAEIDGEVAGMCQIDPRGERLRVRHRASFAVSLQKKFWGIGIGRALTELAMSHAKQAGFEQVEWEVVSGNKAAINLYLSIGAQIIGHKPNALKYADGTYADELIMLKRF